MNPLKLLAVAGLFALTAVASYALGSLTRRPEDWSRQHINHSTDPRGFANEFLGLTIQAPSEGDWELVCEPGKLRPVPAEAGVNKVLEINRMLRRDGADRDWARMDVFVQPLGSGPKESALRRLEFRDLRPGFTVVATERAGIGGKDGEVRLGTWSVRGRAYRTALYHVEHRGRLYAFVGVTEAGAADRFRPFFDQIISSVRLR